MNTLAKTIRERLTSRLWWMFVISAILAFVAFRFGARMTALSILGYAQHKYRDFLAQRRVRLYDRLAKLPGADKFLAVVKSRNPQTGDLATDCVWLLADSAKQAYDRLHAGEWGKDFSIVSLSNGGVSVDVDKLKRAAHGIVDVWQKAKEHPEKVTAWIERTVPKLPMPAVVAPIASPFSIAPKPVAKAPQDTPPLFMRLDALTRPDKQAPWGQFFAEYVVRYKDGHEAKRKRSLNYAYDTTPERVAEICKSVEESVMAQMGDKEEIESIEVICCTPANPESFAKWQADNAPPTTGTEANEAAPAEPQRGPDGLFPSIFTPVEEDEDAPEAPAPTKPPRAKRKRKPASKGRAKR